MRQGIIVVAVGIALMLQPVMAQRAPEPQPAPTQSPSSIKDSPPKDNEAAERSKLTEAAIVALVVAGSIAVYKLRGGPCACPSDLTKNGRVCGGNSAYLRAGGAKPLCSVKDVSPAMIQAYRATKTIPPVW